MAPFSKQTMLSMLAAEVLLYFANLCVSDDRRAKALGVAYLRLRQLQYLLTLLWYLAQWAATAPA